MYKTHEVCSTKQFRLCSACSSKDEIATLNIWRYHLHASSSKSCVTCKIVVSYIPLIVLKRQRGGKRSRGAMATSIPRIVSKPRGAIPTQIGGWGNVATRDRNEPHALFRVETRMQERSSIGERETRHSLVRSGDNATPSRAERT